MDTKFSVPRSTVLYKSAKFVDKIFPNFWWLANLLVLTGPQRGFLAALNLEVLNVIIRVNSAKNYINIEFKQKNMIWIDFIKDFFSKVWQP